MNINVNNKPPYYGKFRGVVADNNDPYFLGRVRAFVPDIYGDSPGGWAMPCAPYGGDGCGFFAVPPIGAGVWIEFEQGDPDTPIWTGCYWTSVTQRPAVLAIPGPFKRTILRSEGGHQIVIDDTPGKGGISIEVAGGPKIEMTLLGIEIKNGMNASVSMTGPIVSINGGALEVI
jgi:uncharacterized protein involved in type VI secretion and phage assembly